MGTVREHKKKNKAHGNRRKKERRVFVHEAESNACIFDERKVQDMRDDGDRNIRREGQREIFGELI